ncbi:MAG TPA: hypothetical protein VIY53_20740 [Acidobacteriaceae bacterium]
MNKPQVSPLALLIVFCFQPAVHAQDAHAFVQNAVNTEIAADQSDHSCWIFQEVDRKSDGSVTQWVAETPTNDVNRVIMKNGHAIPPDQQHKAVDAFVQDQSAQAKQREDNQKDSQQADSLLRLLPEAFQWRFARRGRASTTLQYSPDPSFHPPTREARVFAAMTGTLTVDNQQHRIREFKGRLLHDVDFGGGILGKLEKGGTFRIERSQLATGIWDITQSHIHIQGHALIFKSISEQEDDVKTSWTREPDGVTVQQAAAAVFKR